MNTNPYIRSHTIGVQPTPHTIWPPGYSVLLSNGVGGMSPLRDEDGKVTMFADDPNAQAGTARAELHGVIRALGFDPAKVGPG